MSSLKQDIADFRKVLKRNGGNPQDSEQLIIDATLIQRQGIEDCNGDLRDKPGEADILKTGSEAAEGRLRGYLRARGWSGSFSGDPRGYCVKIHFPDGSYNTWGGKESGYGVPTREDEHETLPRHAIGVCGNCGQYQDRSSLDCLNGCRKRGLA